MLETRRDVVSLVHAQANERLAAHVRFELRRFFPKEIAKLIRRREGGKDQDNEAAGCARHPFHLRSVG